jgi:hypothetical protein
MHARDVIRLTIRQGIVLFDLFIYLSRVVLAEPEKADGVVRTRPNQRRLRRQQAGQLPVLESSSV